MTFQPTQTGTPAQRSRYEFGVPAMPPEIDPGPGGIPIEEPGSPVPDRGPQPYPVDDPPYPPPTEPDVVPTPERPIRI